MRKFYSLFISLLFVNSMVFAQCDINAINTAMQNAGCVALTSLPPNCQNSCSLYFYNPQSLTGTQAQAFAQTYGASLISISDATENGCITAALQQFGGVIWIGFNDIQTEGTFQWYDQAPITYTNWNPATPEPNNNTPSCCDIPLFGCGSDPECTQGEDCTQIFPDGLWNDLYCGASNSSSVIEFNLCPQVTVTSNATNVCSGGSANLSATTILGSNPYTYSWSDGQTGANITVTPAVTTTYTVTSTDRYGCQGTASVTITVDPCTAPISTCDIALITQTFTNAGCIPLNLPPACDNGCSLYFFNPQNLTGSQAQNFARNYGANLISIADATENACITTALQLYGGVIWLGFSDEAQEGNFVWYDQSPITYTHWAGGEPNQSGDEDCVQIYPDGYWNDLECNSGNTKSVIEVNLCPQTTIVPSANNVCAGTQITLNASTILGSDPYAFTWETGASGASITVSPTQTTTYSVTVTDRYSCSAVDSITLTILPKPTTTFTTTSPACENAPVIITYTGDGTSGATYAWNFDGGTVISGSGAGPYQVSWAASGTKNVTLDITQNGCVSPQTSVPVVINPTPIADFTFTTECFETPTILTNTSTGNGGTLAGYLWVIGTDSLLGADQTYTFPNAGTFTVNMGVATTDGCINQTSHQVTVNPNPVAAFSADQVCLNTPTSFTGQSTINGGTVSGFAWDFGDGGTSSSKDTTYIFSTAGNHTVELIATSNLGCSDTITQTVVVSVNPVADFSFQDACADSTVQFTDLSTVSAGALTNWVWDFGNSNNSILQNPTTTYAADGPYTVQLIAYAGNCRDTAIKQITIFENPVAEFTTADVCMDVVASFTDLSSITNGSISTWQWDFGDNGNSNASSPTHQYNPDGTYTVTLTVNTADNCSDQIKQDITIFPEPTADFSVSPVCLNEPSQFTDLSTVNSGSITIYNWNFGDSQTSSLQSPSNTYGIEGTYTVTLDIETNNGCLDNTTQNVTVYPLPIAAFTVDPTEACQPFNISLNNASTITAGSIVSWLWNVSNGFTSTQANPSFYFTQPGTFDVFLKVISDNGCEDSISTASVITIHPKPVAKFTVSPQPADEFNPVIDFTDQSIGSSIWFYDFGDGDTSSTANPKHDYKVAGIYTATQIVFTAFGCSDTIDYDVVIDKGYAFYIPNAVTPNNNKVNDKFAAKGIGYEEYIFYIFDRWGNQIHIGNEGQPDWDATYQDTHEPVPNGVYVYIYDVLDFKGESHRYTGSVTVVH